MHLGRGHLSPVFRTRFPPGFSVYGRGGLVKSQNCVCVTEVLYGFSLFFIAIFILSSGRGVLSRLWDLAESLLRCITPFHLFSRHKNDFFFFWFSLSKYVLDRQNYSLQVHFLSVRECLLHLKLFTQ